MLRKWLFGGLTIMLGAVLVSLILNARKEEARIAKVPSEIVKTAKSTATRVMAPNDLDSAESKVELVPSAQERGKSSGQAARCQLVIRNRGQVAYHDVLVKLSCLGGSGKVLDTRTQLVPETAQPGQILTVTDLVLNDLPRGTVRCTLGIVYASIGPAPAR